ncbi:hypothetical protein STANM309S_05836 [Streptomyces tanashiensis]
MNAAYRAEADAHSDAASRPTDRARTLSAWVAHWAITDGRRSIMPLCRVRASS